MHQNKCHRNKIIFALHVTLHIFIWTIPIPASHAQTQAAQTRPQVRSWDDLGLWSDALRRQVGRSLFDGMKTVLDSSDLILHKFTETQVVFSDEFTRIVSENIVATESRSFFIIVLSACPSSNSGGSNSSNSRIVAVSLELKLPEEEASLAPELLRRLIEAAHRRGTAPITVRTPRPNEPGVVLEWNDQNRRGELFGYFRPLSRAGSSETALTSVRWSFRDESLCRQG